MYFYVPCNNHVPCNFLKVYGIIVAFIPLIEWNGGKFKNHFNREPQVSTNGDRTSSNELELFCYRAVVKTGSRHTIEGAFTKEPRMKCKIGDQKTKYPMTFKIP